MVIHCWVIGCKEKFVKGGPVTFHSIPRNEERRKLWLIKVRRENYRVTKASRICSKHFTEDCYDKLKFGGSWLKPSAVPTIFNFPDQLQKQNPVKVRNSVKRPAEDVQIETVDCNADLAKSTWEKLNNNRDVLHQQRDTLEKGMDSKKIKHSENVTQDIETVTHYINNSDLHLESSSNVSVPTDIISKIENNALRQQQLLQKNRNINVIKLDNSCSSDELFYFFMSMYKITKKMSPSSQHYIRKKIFNLVSDTEEKQLNFNKNSHNSYKNDSISYISVASDSERYYRLKKL